MRCFRIVLLIVVALTAYPAEKKSITHEMMWLMKRVGRPVPSPNGESVVLLVTEPAYDPDLQVADLWMVPADGSEAPRRLTFTKGAESGMAWSPDSARLAFTAKRDGDDESQIYVLDLARGGEAERITAVSEGVSSPVWSPDGKLLLFTSKVYPDAYTEEEIKKAAKERNDRKYNAHVYEGFPIRYWDHWLDDSREHLFVQEAKAGAVARNLLRDSELAKGAGFSLGSAVWTPNGKVVIFSAAVNRDEAAHAVVRQHLFQVSTEGGEPKDLTPGNASYGNQKFSPDGTLHAMMEPLTEHVYNLDNLVRLPWPQRGEPAVLTGAFDRPISDYSFAPGGRTIYLEASDEGAVKIFQMTADGGTPGAIVAAEEGTYSGMAVPEKAAEPIVLASWQSHRSPFEVVRIDPDTKTHKNLTEFNKWTIAELDAQPARQFWFTSKKGRRIHNLLILPPGFDENTKYPLVLFIHGGPHSASTDNFHLRWNYLMMASKGYVVLLTNYTGSVGFGEQFARAIQGDPLQTPGDEINQAADEAIKRYPFIDTTRVAAGGASYGGHLSNWLQATTDRYACLYSHAGLISLEGQWATSDSIYHRERNNGGPYWAGSKIWRQQSPFTYAANFKTPVLVTVGETDYRVPLNQTLGYWSILKRQQVPSRLVVFPRANHWIMNGEDNRYFYEELLGWLAKHLYP
jgi:dipeptidyl aminopeptidase/acylaminoacyl peptidase